MINFRPMIRRFALTVTLSVFTLGLLLTIIATAEPVVWRPIFGTPLNMGTNTVYTTTFGALNLRFPFNGRIYSNTDILSISSNGFVSLGGSNGAGSIGISGSSLVNSTYPRIAALWANWNLTVPNANVYLNSYIVANTNLRRVAVTWQAPFNSASLSSTVQLALQNDGTIVLGYDGLPQSGASGPALVGLSAGQGSTNPGSVNLSANAPFTVTQPTVYELFDDVSSTPVNFDQLNVVFAPSGTSGYAVQIPQTDLAVSQSAGPFPIEPGNPLTYTIVVANQGMITANGVTISDSLPILVGVQFKSASAGCSLATGIVTCNLGTITTSSRVVTATIVVTPTLPGAITNTVSVVGNEVEYPLMLWNNSSSLITAIGQADLSISSSNTPGVVTAGSGSITYTLTITNNGPDTASGVIVSDTLPPGVALASAPASCSGAGIVICAVGSMSANTTQNIVLTGSVQPWARGLITNTAGVSLVEFDPNLTNNTATSNATADASASLLLTKSADPSPAIAGATLTYTLNFTNVGPSAATGIALTDVIPSGVNFGGIVGAGAAYSPTLNAVLWGDHSVRSATYAWIDITNSGTRVVWPGLGGNDEGHASISLPSWAFPWFGSSYNTLYVDPNGNVGFENWAAPTSIGESQIPNPAAPNNRIAAFYTDMVGQNPNICNGQADSVYTLNDIQNHRFIIEYNNWCSKHDGKLNTFEVILSPDGNVTVQYNNVPSAPPVLASQVSPAGVESPDGTTGYAWNESIANNTAWAFQPYFIGSDRVVFTVTVPSSAVTGSSIVNNATITALEPGQTPGNNTVTVTTPVTRIADLSLVKTASATQLPDSGLPITYTLVTTNNGPSDATNVMLTDTLPVSLTLGPITASQGSCNGTSTIVCNLNDLSSTSSATVTIVVTPSQTIANTASATAAETDPNPINNTSTATTTVGTANLSIGISDLPDPVIAGTVLTYTVTVTNVSGNATATGVTLSDTLPAGTTFASASIPCSGTSTLSCSLPNVTLGTSTAATIAVNVAPSARGSIGNSISVQADQYDSDPTNNIASTATAVNAQVDLLLTKTAVSSPKLHPGMPLTYTLVITNNGVSSATGVIVTDTLPLSVTFQSISAGSCLNGVCTITVGALAPNATATVSLIVKPIALGPVTYVIHSPAPTATAVEPTSLTVTNAADVTVTPYPFYLPLIRNQS